MRKRIPTDQIQPHAVSIADAAAMIGVGKSTIWLFIKDGKLKSVRLGRRRLIRIADLHALLDQAGKAA
jgi:excisionase family DNA binding protein